MTTIAHRGRSPHPIGWYVLMNNNGAIAWSVMKLKVVHDSTAEAETSIASKASKELISVHAVLRDLDRNPQGAIYVLGESNVRYHHETGCHG